jgi:hypothetical protein
MCIKLHVKTGLKYTGAQTVLWICIGFNADSDPAFYFNADPDPGSQTKAYPCGYGYGSGPWSDFEVT